MRDLEREFIEQQMYNQFFFMGESEWRELYGSKSHDKIEL